jgi:outer membrane protein assembly factor BamB
MNKIKLFYIFIILILIYNCSFDNKTGIWKNENVISKDDENQFKDFRTLYSPKESFDKIIPLDKNYSFKLIKPVSNFNWKDIFFDKTNNLINLKYKDLNKIIFKSKKLTKYKSSSYILFEKNNLLINDEKGNIIIFSINENKIISKYNFYKKKYKKIKKVLNFLVEDDIVYVSDNIGYLYAYNYQTNTILWAKNYKVPFRSNLKIAQGKLVAANQNNNLFFFNKLNGETLKLIPTEETVVKNKFINNLSLNDESLFFLNTYGSLFSFDKNTMTINWFKNFNQSLNLNPSNLFYGNQIINNKKLLVINSKDYTYFIDTNSGSILFKVNFVSLIKPIISNHYFFSVTKNNLLICFDLKERKVIYSYNINEKISEFFNIKKREVVFKNMMIVNNQIFIFLDNSYLLKFNLNGELTKVTKLPSKINSYPILIDSSLLYLDTKNKVSIID